MPETLYKRLIQTYVIEGQVPVADEDQLVEIPNLFLP
jgi:hypothetical protein